MKIRKCLQILLFSAQTVTANAADGTPPGDTLTLSLPQAIRLAQEQSPTAQSARNTFLSAYWNYRYFRAAYLPSVTLSSTPYLNKETNKITQQDGSAQFLRQDQFGADLSLKINQNIAFTGGSVFLQSTLTRLDELQSKTTAYNSVPLIVGYEQSVFGYNSLKWDRRIEPVRYTEAKKNYAETLELISVEACNHFFSLATAQNELALARQNLSQADTLYRMAQGRYNIGTTAENEMLQLEINRLNEETNVMDATIALEDNIQRFRSYLGLDQTLPVKLVIPDSVPQFSVPVGEALQLALLNSPDPEYYKRIRLESRSRLANARANAGLKADIYVQLGLSQTGQDLSTAYRSPNNQIYASVSLSLPLLDWGRGRGKIKVAKSEMELTETEADQGMRDFTQNVRKLVMQFNMQSRKVSVAAMTDRRVKHRHAVARRLYVLGRNSILDLNASVNERNAARRNYLGTMQAYWQLYYTLRSMTAYDFNTGTPLTEQLPIK